jgi:hypothetical protein
VFAVGFRSSTLCFVPFDSQDSRCFVLLDSNDSYFIFCCLIHIIRVVFVLLESRVLHCILRSWVLKFHFVICAVGFK